MLTRDDLKAMREIVASGNKDLWSKFEKKFAQEIEPLKSEVHVIKKEVDEISEETVENDTFLRRRIRKIEDHLELPPHKK